MWTAVEKNEYGSDPRSYEHHLSSGENHFQLAAQG